jgi:pimeloyl-ACP methyl ester carboxylesterase
VQAPLLFVQGTRDPLADPAVVAALVERLAGRATLHEVAGGDHSFALPPGSARRQAEVTEEIAEAVAAFARSLSAGRR